MLISRAFCTAVIPLSTLWVGHSHFAESNQLSFYFSIESSTINLQPWIDSYGLAVKRSVPLLPPWGWQEGISLQCDLRQPCSTFQNQTQNTMISSFFLQQDQVTPRWIFHSLSNNVLYSVGLQGNIVFHYERDGNVTMVTLAILFC